MYKIWRRPKRNIFILRFLAILKCSIRYFQKVPRDSEPEGSTVYRYYVHHRPSLNYSRMNIKNVVVLKGEFCVSFQFECVLILLNGKHCRWHIFALDRKPLPVFSEIRWINLTQIFSKSKTEDSLTLNTSFASRLLSNVQNLHHPILRGRPTDYLILDRIYA